MRIFPEFLSSSQREREKSGILSEFFFPGGFEGFFFSFCLRIAVV